MFLFSRQSVEAYEFIKRDLTEFSSVVQHDTACSIVATANAVKSKLAVRTRVYVTAHQNHVNSYLEGFRKVFVWSSVLREDITSL